jgi:hypothetical protein
LASLLVAGLLALPGLAQEPVNPAPGLDPAPNTDIDRPARIDNNRVDNVDNTADDDGFNPGWLGLLGLIGLAGLMPRDRRERHIAHTHTHPAGTTVAR